MPLLRPDRGADGAPGLVAHGRKSVAVGTAPGGVLASAVTDGAKADSEPVSRPRPGRSRELFPCCANPGCDRGLFRLLRNRAAPVVEGGWCCSPACTRVRVEAALWRELGAKTAAPDSYRHRIPIGLSMLEQGWITPGQLRRAVGMQREAGGGRLGDWLVRSGAVSESLVARAVGLQWSCPVLPIDRHDPESVAPILPRLFVDALRALPVRVAGGRLLYLGFEGRLDQQVAVAIERINGLRVESGVVVGNQFDPAHRQALLAPYPPCELIEASSESGLARALSSAIERRQPVESRLVRVHDFVWLRMWIRRQSGTVPRAGEVRDLVGAVAAGRGRTD